MADDFYELTADDVARLAAWGNAPPPIPPDTTGIVPYSSLRVEHVDWIIPGHVPVGMLTVLAGEQGLGKSLLHARWAAHLSRQGIGSVLISAEDSPTHTTKARLIAAQADQTRVHHAQVLPVLGNGQDPHWLAKITQWIEGSQSKLIVFDPMMAFIDAASDSYKAQHVRRILAELDAIAQRTGSAIVYVMHLTKAEGANPLKRIAGAGAWTEAARSVVLMTPETDPYAPERIVAHVKCNVAEKALPQRWLVQPILLHAREYPEFQGRDVRTALINYDGIAEGVDVSMLLATRTLEDADAATDRDEAKEIIVTMLGAEGECLSSILERAVRESGISSRTYDRARRELGIRAFQRGRQWFSHAVTSQDAKAQDATVGWRPDKPSGGADRFPF